ncbi:MAG: hypothetical protein DSY33_03465 [Archaeoglobus sp.]|nr:MAG: hypothetical protein DSY33_03465 [Archaeoglobus sp.]
MGIEKLEEIRIKLNSILEEGEKLKIITGEYTSKRNIIDYLKSNFDDVRNYIYELKKEREIRRARKGLEEIKKKKEKPASFFERLYSVFKAEEFNREILRVYVPLSLVKYYRKKYRKNPEKYADLEKALRGCRYPVTVPKYLAISLFYPLLFVPVFFIFGYFFGEVAYSIYMNKIHQHVYTYFPVTLNITHNLSILLASIVSAFLTSLIMFLIIRYMILVYPKMYASHRRGQIEVIFPHVVNMMLGMARGGIPIIEMFQIVADEVTVTGEVGKEFRIIVNRVKVFHENLSSAIRYVASTSPSQKFSDFLDDMISVIEGSGKLSEFLDFKSQHLMNEKEKYQELFLNSLGILAEVYVSALVVAPLFLMIIFVVMGMMEGYSIELMKLIIYIYMPVGGLMFIWLLSSMMSEYEVKWTGEKFRKSRLSARVCTGRAPGFTYPGKFLKMYYELVRQIKTVLGDLKIFIYRPEYSFYITLPAFFLSLPLFYRQKYETIFVLFLLITVTPYSILVEIRNKRIKKIEEHIPDFLKQLASLNESGLNIVSAIRVLSASNLGALTSEIQLIRKDLEWGMLLSDALKRFERRVSSMTVTKVTSILLKAMEAAGTVKDALYTAANDAQLYLEQKNRMKNEMFVYIVVIYMTFGVFLFTIYILTSNFIQVFSKMHIPNLGSSYIQFRVPNLNEMTRLFYHTSIINGTVSGLIAGLMGEGELRAGLKHVLILVMLTYIVFTFLLGY